MAGQTFNYRRVRGVLASERITIKRYAQACGLSYSLVSRILCGQKPGELAQIKLSRGIAKLGLEQEVADAS